MIFIPDNPIARLLEAPPHQRMALRAIMRGRNLNQSQIDRFLKHGVEAINLFKAWSTQADCVTFSGEYFEFADDNDVSGVQVFTMGVIGEIGLIDVLAWHPSSGRLATWLGLGFGLGEAEINHHVDNDSAGLAVFRTPLNWLRAGCEGIVIVHKAFANIALANVRRLIAEDENHRKELLGMFPFGGPRILVRDPKDPNSGVELEVAA